MGITIRVATDEDIDEIVLVDGRAFGQGFTTEQLADHRPTMDMQRFRLACDGSEIVGVAGSFDFDVTLPGGASVPMGGVTWVSVSATHRRRGILRQLMDAIHADIDDRGEPVAMLGASEGGIYERFGYGVASWMRAIEIDTNRTAMRPEFIPAPGSVRFVVGAESDAHVRRLWERYRRAQPGEFSRNDAWHRLIATVRSRAEGEISAAHTLAHRDGYASYRLEPRWNQGMPAHVLYLAEFVALTPDAHAALWSTLLSVDLVGTVRSDWAPVDDPLPYLLTNPRAVRTTNLSDQYWANVRDVATCFSTRTYSTQDRMVIESDGRRWAIEGNPSGGVCHRVRSKPDLVVAHAQLGSLLFGSTPASRLAAGRRITGTPAALRRADAFFGCRPAAFSQTRY